MKYRHVLIRAGLLLVLSVLTLCGCVSNPVVNGYANVTTDQTFGRYDEALEPNLILVTVTPEHHAALTKISAMHSSDVLPVAYASFLKRMNTQYGLSRVADWPLATINVFCIVFEYQGDKPRGAIVEALGQEPGIETAQIVQTFEVQALKGYNDPYLSLQHGLHSLQAIVSHSWSRGKGVRVAVIDTGTDSSHPDLKSSTELTRNFVDNDDVAFRNDVHGTAVGGIIAAVADNKTGMVGVAPDARLLALKACWQNKNNRDSAICNSLTLAKAINFSIAQGVDIINLSLAGPLDPLLKRLLEAALAKNIIVVGSKPAHNRPAFPISVEGTIAVALPSADSKLLSAPGRRVLSTKPGQQYDFFNGSSFSTAHISGLAAVIRGLSPALRPNELLALLENTADPNTGAVNACRAVAAIVKPTDTSFTLERCL